MSWGIPNGRSRKIIKAARDQLKKTPQEIQDTNLLSLEDFLEDSLPFPRRAWEDFLNTPSGKNWSSNVRYAFKNLQILCPNTFKKLDGSLLTKFYEDENAYKSILDKLSLLKKFIENDEYRSKLLKL